MEMLTTQFEVMLGSTEKANNIMKELKTFAATTPFALKDLAQGSQTLLSFGVAQKDVIQRMRMLGDASGGSREKLNGLILAFGKVQTKGKASMEEINMIAERGVPIIGTLTKQLGVTEEEFFKLVSAGKIGRKEITQAFQTMTAEGGIFFKGMEKQSLTLGGLISTMKDNFSLLLAEIGEGLLPSIKEFVGLLTQLAQGPLKEFGKGLTAVLIPIFQALSKILPKLITFLVPILQILGEIIGELLIGLLPVLDLLEPILELITALMPILRIIIKMISFLIPIVVFFLKIAIKGLTFLIKVIMKVVSFIGNAIKFVVSGVGTLFVFLKDFFTRLIMFYINLFKMIFNFVVSRVKGIVNAIIKFIKSPGEVFRKMIDKLIGFFINFKNSVVEVLSGLGEWITLLFTSPIEAIKVVWNEFIEFFNTVFDSIVGKIRSLVEWVKGIPDTEINIPDIDSQGRIKKETLSSFKKTNINIDNKFNINAPTGPAPGQTGLTPQGVGKIMKDSARSVISLELQKIVQASQ